MDFFARQAQAQRLTWLLIGQFSLAVVAILLALNALAYGFSGFWRHPPAGGFWTWLRADGWMVTVPALVVLTIGSLHRATQLRRGAGYLAVLAGGHLVSAATQDPLERRLLHVTEEMSLASGAPVPRVFVLQHEPAINAFVTGMRLHDTALVATRGALEQLGRDELQAVVGHEFSHIQHQDMRLNGRILMLLGGIMLLPTLGRRLLGLRRGRPHLAGRHGRQEVAAALLGVALFVVGYLGLFAARLIQAAIARQRELHADAAAVQFTRNPSALAGALHRILTASEHSYLTATPLAEELNHMCFGPSRAVNRWFASHPPLDERIAAIDPRFRRRQRPRERQPGVRKEAPTQPQATPVTAAKGANLQTPDTLVAPNDPRSTGQTLWAMDTRTQLATRYRLDELTGVEVLALLVSSLRGDPEIHDDLPQDLRFPLLELLVGRLRQDTAALQDVDFATLRKAAEDGQGNPLERFCQLAYLERQMRPSSRRTVTLKDYRKVREDLAVLLSLFVRLDRGTQPADVVFAEISRRWFPLDALSFRPSVTANSLRGTLERLAHLAPVLKPAILDACAEAVMLDGEILAAEYELLRVAAVLIDCPMPRRLPLR